MRGLVGEWAGVVMCYLGYFEYIVVALRKERLDRVLRYSHQSIEIIIQVSVYHNFDEEYRTRRRRVQRATGAAPRCGTTAGGLRERREHGERWEEITSKARPRRNATSFLKARRT